MMRRFRKQNGFTLMETLLAVTLFTIVSLSTYSVFSMGIQIWKRSKGSTAEERRLLLALEKIGQDIRSIPAGAPKTEQFSIADKIEIKLDGSDSKLMIPALFTAHESQLGGFGRVTYEWKQATQEICVQRETLTDLYRKKPLPCKTLASKVSKFKLRYWLESELSGSHSWYNQWDGESALPKAIELTAELAGAKPGDQKRSYKKTVVIPVGGIVE